MTAERLALLGHPVSHSRSPAMMRAAFRACGIDGEYTAFDVPGDLLGDAVRGLAALGFLGANITLPHKVTVMPHLASIDGAAVLVGAVNTLARPTPPAPPRRPAPRRATRSPPPPPAPRRPTR